MTTIFKNLPPYLESGNKCAHEFGIPGPEFVVLELPHNVVNRARQHIGKDFQDPRTKFRGVDEIMENIFAYVGEERSAKAGVESLEEHLVSDADSIDQIDDGVACAEEAGALGKAVIDALKANQLYDSHGLCFYTFRGWIDPHSALLVKYLEEDPADIEYMHQLTKQEGRTK